MPGEAAHIGPLDEQAVAELAANAEVHVDGVGRLQFLIDRIGHAEDIGIRLREAALGRGRQRRRRNVEVAGIAGRG